MRYGLSLLGQLVLWMILLSACREEVGLLPEQSPNNSDLFAPTQATIVAGCETGELEGWYESFSANSHSFYAEAPTFTALASDSIALPINRLGDLRDAIMALPVPECVAPLHGQQQANMTAVIDAFVAYQQGETTQTDLQSVVEDAQQRHNNELLPEIEALQGSLTERLDNAPNPDPTEQP